MFCDYVKVNTDKYEFNPFTDSSIANIQLLAKMYRT